ncbi:MAG: FHA domain-containing protein, partial [Planctomycetales bacterium]
SVIGEIRDHIDRNPKIRFISFYDDVLMGNRAWFESFCERYKAEINIGRSEDCDVRPVCTEISRHHCQIESEAENVILRDLFSANGTFLNGNPVTDAVSLKDGDVIGVGSLQMQVTIFTNIDGPTSAGRNGILGWEAMAEESSEELVSGSSQTHVGAKDRAEGHELALTRLVGEAIERYLAIHQDIGPDEVKAVLQNVLEALEGMPAPEVMEPSSVPPLLTRTWPDLPQEIRSTIMSMLEGFVRRNG